MPSDSPVELGTNPTGPTYVTPKAKRPSTEPTVDDVLTFIRLDSEYHDAVKEMVPHADFLLAHADSVDTIQKLFQTALPGTLSDFTTYTLATMVAQLGSYLSSGGKWTTDLSYADVLARLATLRRTTMTSPIPPAPSPISHSSDSGTKLMKVFDKTKWDKTEESYPEWKESILDTLGFAPKALAQYKEESAAADDPDLALITFTALLDAVSNSDAHTAIKELPESLRTGFHAWQAMEQAMEGDDRKEHFRTLAETALKSLHKDSSMSVLQLRGHLRRIFALFKAADQEMTEESKMKTLCRKMKEDPDFKSTADSTLLDIRSKSIVSFDAVAQRFKNLEDENKYQDLTDTIPELNSRARRAPTSDPGGRSTNQSFKDVISSMSWPSGLWQEADSKTKLYLIKWKKALSSASSFKDVRSLKAPTPSEVEEYEKQ
jgi:hypothetical protein